MDGVIIAKVIQIVLFGVSGLIIMIKFFILCEEIKEIKKKLGIKED